MDGTASDQVVDLLHCLGFIYLRHGQHQRAVVLLILAAQSGASARPEVLRTLCAALIAAGMGRQALEIVDRLAALEPDGGAHPMMRLMHARALLLLGRGDEARAVFRAAPAAPGDEPFGAAA